MLSDNSATTKSLVHRQRARMMGGASVALIATLLSGTAYASPEFGGARATVSVDGSSNLQGNAVVGSAAPQTNNATVDAIVGNATTGIQRTGSSSGNTDTVSANTITAKAGANSFSNGDDTLLSSIGTWPSDGIAVSGVSINNGTVTSQVYDSATGISLTNAVDGQVSNSGNTISATTTLNNGTSTVGGIAPVGYQSSMSPAGVTVGSSLGFNDGESLVDARGTVVVSSVQQSLNGGASTAVVSGSSASLDLNNTGTNSYSGAAALEANRISATFTGNQATSGVSLGSATSGFQGSATVANVQQFDGTNNFYDFNGRGSDQASANTTDSSIRARIGNYDDEEGYSSTTLTGNLSVAGNSITSAAHGNQALAPAGGTQSYGNQIKLADGQSFTGTGAGGDVEFLGGNGAIAAINYGAGYGAAGAASADLAIANSQSLGNVESGGAVTSLTRNAYIAADVQAVNGASVTLANNTIDSAATGNAASSGIVTGANAATFSGTTAIANMQSNRGVPVIARTEDAEIGLWSDDYSEGLNAKLNSQLSVTGNSVASSAHGNDAVQAISLTATTLGNRTAPAQAGFIEGMAVATGGASIVSAQSNQFAPIQAHTDAEISVGAEGYADPSHSALLLDSNRAEAVAIGSTASNSLSLNGTSVNGGAGVANTQFNLNSPVSATTYTDLEGYVDNTLRDGSTLSVTNNLARAIAYGNKATNAASVQAGNLTIDQAGGNNIPFSGASGAVAAVNGQFNQSDVSADLEGGTWAYVDNGVLGGAKLTNSSNTLVAASYGNQASNSADLSLTSLTVNPVNFDVEENPVPGRMASLGGLVNVQSAIGNTISASANYVGVDTYADHVDASSVDSSHNVIQSVATANRADSNNLTISGVTLADADNYSAGFQTVNEPGRVAGSVYNAQTSAANVFANTMATDSEGGYRGVQVNAGYAVSNASVTARANQQIASASGNVANNGLSLAATTVQTTSGLQNMQANDGPVTATLGYAGTPASPGTPDQPFNFTVTVSQPSANCVGGSSGNCSVTGGTASVSTQGLTQAQILALTNSGWTQNGSVLTRSATYLGTMTFSAYGALTESGQTYSSLVPGLPATSGTPNGSGVTIAASDSVVNSALQVANNVGAAMATGNTAANVLKVSATTLSADGSNGLAYIGQTVAFDSEGAGSVRADHGVINSQSSNGPIQATSFGTYAIDGGTSLNVVDSTLDVSGNQQNATAFGNTAVTSLTAAMGTIEGPLSAGLLSTQTSGSSIYAASNLEAFAPVVSSGSTVKLSDNTNTATAVANDASNSMSATSTVLADEGYSYSYADSAGAQGNLALRNEQTTTGAPVTAAAVTTIANGEGSLSYTGGETTFGGIRSGSVAMDGNKTLAQAVANQASNQVALNVGTGQGGSSALSNVQTNASSVTSDATSTIGLSLAAQGDNEYGALNASGLSITGNSTVASARGNVAVNAATATTNGTNGDFGNRAYAGSGYAEATNAVLNSQSNSAAINATATSMNNMQVLNGAMANSAVALAGNTTLASAYGNAATNTLTINQAVGAVPSGAVANSQYNSGNVSARVTSVNYTFGANGVANGSSVGVSGNAIGATAVGNSAVSTITTGR